jgi:hypothetical protein
MGETIEEATRKFAFEFYQREQPALVEAMQQLLDAGQTEGQIRASIKRSAAFAGQPAWKTRTTFPRRPAPSGRGRLPERNRLLARASPLRLARMGGVV